MTTALDSLEVYAALRRRLAKPFADPKEVLAQASVEDRDLRAADEHWAARFAAPDGAALRRRFVAMFRDSAPAREPSPAPDAESSPPGNTDQVAPPNAIPAEQALPTYLQQQATWESNPLPVASVAPVDHDLDATLLPNVSRVNAPAVPFVKAPLDVEALRAAFPAEGSRPPAAASLQAPAHTSPAAAEVDCDETAPIDVRRASVAAMPFSPRTDSAAGQASRASAIREAPAVASAIRRPHPEPIDVDATAALPIRASPAPVHPFVSAPEEEVAKRLASVRQSNERRESRQGPVPPTQETAELDPSTFAMMASAFPFASPESKLTLEQFASLTASIEVFPEHAEEILRRFGVSESGQRGAVTERWRAKIERDPTLAKEHAELVARYGAYLQERRRRGERPW